jgi:Rhodanese-like domain
MDSQVLWPDLALEPDRPVVTVCSSGKVSQTAAEILAQRGFNARSLVGGMKAWSLAWNAADVSVADPSVHVIQMWRTGKGCLPYIHGDSALALLPMPATRCDILGAPGR